MSGNNKKKKNNKMLIIIMSVVAFFMIYLLTFKLFRAHLANNTNADIMSVDTGSEKNVIQEEIERKKALELKKGPFEILKSSKKIYISDEQVDSIKIEGDSLESFKRNLEMFVKIRSIDDRFKPLNKGVTDNEVEFETDFNYFRVKKKNKTEYYKVPVSMKKSFETTYRKMMYTSLDFITSKKNLGDIKIFHGNEEKGVWPWKKDDLMHKILYKREVGKIQPEKEFSKNKSDSYTIKIDKSGVKITIQTMGKDFIKVVCGDNIAYYEVYPELYEYLKKIFK
ncbi:hypothetical protein [Peptostreptococcus faecalis]|uniref:hypothetical protein n=1 Tax=Peptostreptococcus faecalis TaxID=2045015 RepID=UPI000C7B409D|nr:hypothetical protein [Peptostreptococcus faecalis]